MYVLQASKNAAHHDEIQMGLFYVILTEPKLASRVSEYLFLIFIAVFKNRTDIRITYGPMQTQDWEQWR